MRDALKAAALVLLSCLSLLFGMYAFDVPADLPMWRKLLGLALVWVSAGLLWLADKRAQQEAPK